MEALNYLGKSCLQKADFPSRLRKKMRLKSCLSTNFPLETLIYKYRVLRVGFSFLNHFKMLRRAWQRKSAVNSCNILISESPVSYCTTDLFYMVWVASLWNCKESWMTGKKVECYLANGTAVPLGDFS